MTRRFGREATEYLAEPLLAGIHAGDVDRLSLRALFPRFADAEQKHGSLLRAFRSQQVSAEGRVQATGTLASPAGASAEAGAFKSLPGGLSELVRALCAVLPRDRVQLDTAVSGIASVGGERPYRVDTTRGSYDARAVVLAAPAFVTASLVRSLDADLARLCGDVPYASIATVALAFRRDAVAHPLNGSGYVVPRTEGNGILAASWLSSKWPGRAPDDMVLLRTFIGGARNPDALERSDAGLVATSLEALRPVLGVRGDPLFARVYRFDRANAQHEVGHLDRVAKIDAAIGTHPGLFVTGSGFRGVGIPDCVADGRTTASRAAEWLRTRRI